MEDAALLPRLDKLAPYATAPPPSLPQLGDDLIRQESSLPAEAGGGVEPNSLRLRIETALRHLISVRPLHDPRFSPLEAALQAQDAAQAQTAFQALPEAFQKNLGAWQEKFKARLALEKTLQDVAAALTEPSP